MWHDMTGDKDVGQQDEACRYDADIMIRHCGKDITGTSACWYIVHLIAHLITHTHHTLIAHFARYVLLSHIFISCHIMPHRCILPHVSIVSYLIASSPQF